MPAVVIGQPPASTERQKQRTAAQVIAEVRTTGYALRVSQLLLTPVECGANLMEDDRIDD